MNAAIQRLGFAVVLAASCRADAGEGKLAPGTWGGDRAILLVSEKGASLDFECARGSIPKPIVVDGKGEFDVDGVLASDGPGPTRGDDEGTPVKYHGRIKGESMTLTVRDAKAEIGQYDLTRGREPILRKCR